MRTQLGPSTPQIYILQANNQSFLPKLPVHTSFLPPKLPAHTCCRARRLALSALHPQQQLLRPMLCMALQHAQCPGRGTTPGGPCATLMLKARPLCGGMLPSLAHMYPQSPGLAHLAHVLSTLAQRGPHRHGPLASQRAASRPSVLSKS